MNEYSKVREFVADYCNGNLTGKIFEDVCDYIYNNYSMEYIKECEDFSNEFSEAISMIEDKNDNHNIYVLTSTGMNRRDAEKHLVKGTSVYELDEYLRFFDEYSEGLDEDGKEELRTFLLKGEDNYFRDSELVTYEGRKYFIEYCL